jgi:hypothetical protein
MNYRPLIKYAAVSVVLIGSVVGLTAAIKKRTARLEAEEAKRKADFTGFIAEQKAVLADIVGEAKAEEVFGASEPINVNA